MPSLREALIELVRGAGQVVMGYFRRLKESEIGHKGKINLVTEADLKAEEYIASYLRERFPDHSIVGEEGASRQGSSDFLWLVDPLDGTTNFAHGFPIFAVSVGLMRREEVVLGAVYDPVHDELFIAERGAGALLNGRPIRVSPEEDLEGALLATGFPYDVHESEEDNLDFFSTFMHRAQAIRRAGSAAIDLCYVACGRFDGFWELKLYPWDVAAGWVIVEEAGGLVTDMSGAPLDLWHPNPLAANPTLHGKMAQVIAEVRRARSG